MAGRGKKLRVGDRSMQVGDWVLEPDVTRTLGEIETALRSGASYEVAIFGKKSPEENLQTPDDVSLEETE